MLRFRLGGLRFSRPVWAIWWLSGWEIWRETRDLSVGVESLDRGKRVYDGGVGGM